MRTYPDESKLPKNFGADVVVRATDGGILRVELERMSGQSCRKWFRYMEALAAKYGLRAIRHRYAVGSFTRFIMVT